MSSADPGIASRTLKGMAWAYGSYVGGRILVLISTAVLARLLTPEDFGLVAFAITLMAFLDGVVDLGFSTALVIQREEELEDWAETVFVGSVAIGFVLTCVVAALSPLGASFFGAPELVGIASALGCNFFLRTLGSTHYAIAQKRMDFRARTSAESADVLIRGLVGIGLAVAGFGAWSLVIGYLVGTVAMNVTLWRMVPWRPRLRPRRAHLRELSGFGGTISAVSVAATFIAHVDYLFVGRVLGASALGLYTLGFRLPELIVLNISLVASQVLFPAFSSMAPEDLGRAFRISLRYTLMLSLPLAVGLIVLAESFVLTAFGEQWLDSVEAMQILAVYAVAVTFGVPAGSVYKATGRAGVLLVLALVRLALVVALLAAFIDDGITAAATVQAGVACGAELVGLALASRLLRVSPREIWSEFWPTLVATAAMLPVVLLIERAIDSAWLALLLAGPAGGLVYVGALALTAPDSLRYLWVRMKGTEPPQPQDDLPTPGGPERVA